MKVKHKTYNKNIGNDSVKEIGLYDWNQTQWEDVATLPEVQLNTDGTEIEYDTNGDGEFFEVWTIIEEKIEKESISEEIMKEVKYFLLYTLQNEQKVEEFDNIDLAQSRIIELWNIANCMGVKVIEGFVRQYDIKTKAIEVKFV